MPFRKLDALDLGRETFQYTAPCGETLISYLITVLVYFPHIGRNRGTIIFIFLLTFAAELLMLAGVMGCW